MAEVKVVKEQQQVREYVRMVCVLVEWNGMEIQWVEEWNVLCVYYWLLFLYEFVEAFFLLQGSVCLCICFETAFVPFCLVVFFFFLVIFF